MRIRIIMGLMIAIGVLAAPSGTSAGIWAWRCQGQLGEQQLIFNRDSMAVIESKQPLGDIRHNEAKTINLLEKASVTYQPQNSNDGLTSPIEFVRTDDAKRKIVLTEKASRRISHRHKMICGRDEDTDIYRKVYRFEREAEPARDITMQCLEYQLSTAGGRRCD